MRNGFKSLAVVVATAALLLIPPSSRVEAATQQQTGGAKAKHRTHSAKRHTSRHHSRGYGFLPGYRPRLPNSVPIYSSPRSRSAAARAAMIGDDDIRYWHYGQYLYGWGPPRFFRGRWNGGGFGPCWETTPIGLMWSCGR